MRILIVEDEKILAGQLAEQLRLSGFVTDLCHDGNEAGFLGETEPYDAIILDLGLPTLDGLTILKRWRKVFIFWMNISKKFRNRISPPLPLQQNMSQKIRIEI